MVFSSLKLKGPRLEVLLSLSFFFILVNANIKKVFKRLLIDTDCHLRINRDKKKKKIHAFGHTTVEKSFIESTRYRSKQTKIIIEKQP